VVFLSVMTVSRAKLSEPIENPFGVWIHVPRNHMLQAVQIPTREGSIMSAKQAAKHMLRRV